MKRAAVFFDRDNTLIANDGYLGDPNGVVLVDGAADAVARARELGYAVVVFSNQSGVARGMFAEEAVHAVNHRMDEMLLDENARAVIDRHEFCPHHPEAAVERYRQDSDLRKPKPGMILQAERQLALDLPRSWVVGDAPRDIDAGKAAGCRTILVKDSSLTPSEAASRPGETTADFEVGSLREAMDVIAQNPAPSDDARPGPESTANQEGPAQEDAADETQEDAAPVVVAPDAERAAVAPTAQPQPESEPDQHAESEQQLEPAPTPEQRPEPAPGPAAAAPVKAVETPNHAPTPEPEPAAAARSGDVGERAAAAERPVPEGAVPRTPVRSDSPAAVTDTDADVDAGYPSVVEEDDVEQESDRNGGDASSPPPRGKSRQEILLGQILDELRRRNEQPHDDFSVSKLVAGIVQVLSLAALFYTYLSRDKVDGTPWMAIATAIFLQVFTIALLIMGKQK